MTNIKIARVAHLDWETLVPGHEPTGRYVLLRGPSGYSGAPHRYILGRYEPERHGQPDAINWRDHGGDSVLEGGEMPTEYAEL